MVLGISPKMGVIFVDFSQENVLPEATKNDPLPITGSRIYRFVVLVKFH